MATHRPNDVILYTVQPTCIRRIWPTLACSMHTYSVSLSLLFAPYTQTDSLGDNVDLASVRLGPAVRRPIYLLGVYYKTEMASIFLSYKLKDIALEKQISKFYLQCICQRPNVRTQVNCHICINQRPIINLKYSFWAENLRGKILSVYHQNCMVIFDGVSGKILQSVVSVCPFLL